MERDIKVTNQIKVDRSISPGTTVNVIGAIIIDNSMRKKVSKLTAKEVVENETDFANQLWDFVEKLPEPRIENLINLLIYLGRRRTSNIATANFLGISPRTVRSRNSAMLNDSSNVEEILQKGEITHAYDQR